MWLPSGGSLVIDRTEAMTVVDVNTGKFVGSGGNLEETVTKNNLEAAEEIVRQLRLRDIGGIIVVDFIDMVLESNRDLVLRRLVECLGRDRTKHQVAEVTSLGLVQMTRKSSATVCSSRSASRASTAPAAASSIQEAPVEPKKEEQRRRRTWWPRWRPQQQRQQSGTTTEEQQPGRQRQGSSRVGRNDPADNKPADNKPADDKPVDNKPADDKPVEQQARRQQAGGRRPDPCRHDGGGSPDVEAAAPGPRRPPASGVRPPSRQDRHLRSALASAPAVSTTSEPSGPDGNTPVLTSEGRGLRKLSPSVRSACRSRVRSLSGRAPRVETSEESRGVRNRRAVAADQQKVAVGDVIQIDKVGTAATARR